VWRGSTSISSATEEVRLLGPRTSSLRSPSSVIVRADNPEETLLGPTPTAVAASGTNSVTLRLSTEVVVMPRAPYPLRRGLLPSTSVSRDKFDGNCPAVTSGEGRGVSALEGMCSVEPLGVRIGEEVYEEPLMEEMERVEGIRRGVESVKFSVCILNALLLL